MADNAVVDHGDSVYDKRMRSFELKRCSGIVLVATSGRNRGRLTAPRRCGAPAVEGSVGGYCSVHGSERSRPHQELLARVLRPDWEVIVAAESQRLAIEKTARSRAALDSELPDVDAARGFMRSLLVPPASQ